MKKLFLATFLILSACSPNNSQTIDTNEEDILNTDITYDVSNFKYHRAR